MKNIINKIVKSPLLIIVVVVVIISCIGTSYALGPYLYNSNEINYDNTESGLQSDNVQDAVDELFQHATDYTSMNSRVSELEGIIIDNASDNAGFHNSIFRGKDVSSYYSDGSLYTRISGGTFEDLYVGDYIKDSNNRIWRIAGFDIYYGKGDTALTSHHAAIVPDLFLSVTSMNEEDSTGVTTWEGKNANITQGAYVGSKMYNVTLPSLLSTYVTPIFGEHVIQYNSRLTDHICSSCSNRTGNNTTGASDRCNNYDTTINLMNTVQVTGNIGFSSSGYDIGNDNTQFPLFRLNPSYIVKQRSSYWVRDVVSAQHFGAIGWIGLTNFATASQSSGYGVRPYFYID